MWLIREVRFILCYYALFVFDLQQLVRGNIWIDAKTYLPLRMEGEPAKNPSWLVRDVHIALLYSDVGGMWLQTSLEATATVRILGTYRLISRDMQYQIKAPPPNSTRNYETYSPE
jgi:hypothetical protein